MAYNNLSSAMDEATGCEFQFSVDPPELYYSPDVDRPDLYFEIKCRFPSWPTLDFKTDMIWWDPQDSFPIGKWLHDAGIPLAAQIDAFRKANEYVSTSQVLLDGIWIKYSIYYGVDEHDDDDDEYEFERMVTEQQSSQQESIPTSEFDIMVTEEQPLQVEESSSPTPESERILVEFEGIVTEQQPLQQEPSPTLEYERMVTEFARMLMDEEPSSPTPEFERMLAEFERIVAEEHQTTQVEESSMRATPASREAVEALERVTIKGDERERSCAVCLEEFLIGLEVTKMPCSHLFHGDCIGRWLEDRCLCPLCRFELPLEEEPVFDEMEMAHFMLPPSHEILVESIYV